MNLEKYFDRIYEDYDLYLTVPVLLLMAAFAVLGFNYISSGEFVAKGLDFTGGTEFQFAVEKDFSTVEVERAFSNAGRDDVQAVTQTAGGEESLIVRIPPPSMNAEEATQVLDEAGYSSEIRSQRSISGAVSDEFFKQAQLAFVMAFTIMSLVIFYAFKDLTPSMAVIFAAGADIIFALAGMAVFNIPLTLGSFAALLMLIGYSVDTDIVLSTRVLKRRRGALKGRIWSSVKTGVTMSSGGIAGFTLLLLVSRAIVGPSELSNIAAVMVIGLLADMPFTWFGNAIILKKYVEGDMDSLSRFSEVIPWN